MTAGYTLALAQNIGGLFMTQVDTKVYVVIKKHCCGGSVIQAIFAKRENAEAYKQLLKNEARDENPYFDAEIEFLVKEYDLQ